MHLPFLIGSLAGTAQVATLRISADYGYGEKGMPPLLPPNAELSFEVELLGAGADRAKGASVCDSFCVLS